jgi:hypothetical protein
MMPKWLKNFWTHLLIVFDHNYTVEGFEKTQKKFELPQNFSQLDPATKRKITICNLFANQNSPIREIVRVLDSSLHQVIPTLIEYQLVKERRRKRGTRGLSSERNPLSMLHSVGGQQPIAAKKSDLRTIIEGSRLQLAARSTMAVALPETSGQVEGTELGRLTA